MKRAIFSIFICLLAVFLMSHNVYASLPTDLHLYSVVKLPYWQSSNGEAFHSGNYSFGSNTGTYNGSTYIKLRNAANGNVNNPAYSFIRLTGTIILNSAMNNVNSYEYSAQPNGYFIFQGTANTDCIGIDLEFDHQESYEANAAYRDRYNFNATFYCYAAVAQPTLNIQIMNQTSPLTSLSQMNIHAYSIWIYEYDNVDLGGVIDGIDEMSEKLDDLKDTIQDQQDAEDDAVDNIDNQSTDDIDSGDNSSATNLIGNIGNIFTQIQNIPASSTCSVPADFGHLNLGNINFCSGKENLPFVVSFGAYVFEFVFVVGCSIIIVKRVLSLYDWSRR